MREIRSYGSVRGVAGDRYPYRDRSKTYGNTVPDREANVTERRTVRTISCLYVPHPIEVQAIPAKG